MTFCEQLSSTIESMETAPTKKYQNNDTGKFMNPRSNIMVLHFFFLSLGDRTIVRVQSFVFVMLLYNLVYNMETGKQTIKQHHLV